MNIFSKRLLTLTIAIALITGCKSSQTEPSGGAELVFGDDGLTDYDAMRADTTRTLEEFKADSLVIEAEYNLKNSLNDEAIMNLDKVIVLNPTNDEAYYMRGMAKFDLKDYAGSLQDANKTLELNPDYIPAYQLRGDSYTFLKDYVKAEADYNYLLSQTPDDIVAVYRRGLMYLENGNYKAAITDFNSFIDGNEYHSGIDVCGECYYMRAQAHFKAGNIKQACTDWQAGANLDYQLATEALIKICK